MPHKAGSLSFNGLNKASLLICRESEGREKKTKESGTKALLAFILFGAKTEREEGKRENQLLGTPEYYFLSFPSTSYSRKKIGKKLNYSANLSLAVAGPVLKKTIKAGGINL